MNFIVGLRCIAAGILKDYYRVSDSHEEMKTNKCLRCPYCQFHLDALERILSSREEHQRILSG